MTMTPNFRDSECRDIRAWLDSYLSGELLVETTGAVETHLGRCPACRTEFDRRRRFRERLCEVLAVEPDTTALAARIEAGLSAHTTNWRGVAGWVAAAAAALLLGTTFWRVALQPGTAGDAGALVESGAAAGPAAAPSHDTIAARLVDASIYIDSVMSHTYCALSRALTAPPTAPAAALTQLASYSGLVAAVSPDLEGYTILDAHICPNGTRRFAHLVLERGTERASVLVTEKQEGDLPMGDGLMNAVGGTDVHIRREGHFAVAAVENDRYAGFIVQDADQPSPTFPTPAVARDLAGYLKHIGTER